MFVIATTALDIGAFVASACPVSMTVDELFQQVVLQSCRAAIKVGHELGAPEP